ncbi:NmrA/HSCARG family protein [Scytonema tolypothrichoides VB-61278]|nr:NmrA/HSCARG family protein [Scytonema tolypothrichoides VB-61278]
MEYAQQRVLVYGATGVQGGSVVRQLLQHRHQVRVVVRDPGKAQALGQSGAEVVVGDLKDPVSLKTASEGIDAVFLVLPLEFSTAVVEYGRNAIDAAKAAGVNHIVFNTSVVVANASTNVKALDLKREVQRYLQQSGLSNIILRPTFYMENLAAPWSAPTIVQQGTVAYPMTSDFKASWISVADVAALAVEALKRPDLSGSIFNIGGPEVLTGHEIAQQFASVFGRAVNYYPIPLDQFEQQMNAGMGEPIGTEIAALYRWFVEQPQSPAIINMQPVVQKLPVQLTSLKQWILSQNWSNLARTPVSQT